MKNLFNKKEATEVIDRINQLTPQSPAQWGKMNSAQMMAHVNVAYEMIYEQEKHKKPNAIARFMLKLIVKNVVVSDKPYKKNNRTAPEFVIDGDRDFEVEKKRLIDYINKTQEKGESWFDGRENINFGKLDKTQWNNLFSKHLEHHLQQFDV